MPHGKVEQFQGPGFIWMSPANSISSMARQRLSLPGDGGGVCSPWRILTVSAKEKFLMYVADNVSAV